MPHSSLGRFSSKINNQKRLDSHDDRFGGSNEPRKPLSNYYSANKHLDRIVSYIAVSRIFKENGQIMFLEPLGSNSVVNLNRVLTPNLRTADVHPLKEKDQALLCDCFSSVDVEYFIIFTLLAVPFRSKSAFHRALAILVIIAILVTIDRTILKVLFLRYFACMVVIHDYNPKK